MEVAIIVIALVVGLLFVVVMIRIVQIYQHMQRARRRSPGGGFGASQPSTKSHRTKPCKTLVVLGSGGHTSEMLHMVRQLDTAAWYRPIHYVVAATDHTSVQRLEAIMQIQQQQQPFIIHTIPRSREVGQSYASSLVTTLYALLHSILLTIRLRPELLLTNGPGTCVPIVLGCWMLRILGWPCTMVFCESYCRVETLSLSGKLLYPLVDCFLVHWDELHERYPQSYRLSTFVQSSNQKSQ